MRPSLGSPGSRDLTQSLTAEEMAVGALEPQSTWGSEAERAEDGRNKEEGSAHFHFSLCPCDYADLHSNEW